MTQMQLHCNQWGLGYVNGLLSGEQQQGELRGEMRLLEPMRKHTSWRTGGVAQRYYIPADLADLSRFLRQLPADEPVCMIGLGSNLLVRDGGVRGTVIAVHARLNELKLLGQQPSGGVVFAGAGVACAKVARFAATHRLAGAEFLAGIPGTVGGALAMNAGCYGSETWERVTQANVINRQGEITVREPADFAIGYRHVRSRHCPSSSSSSDWSGRERQDEWFVGGSFRLDNGDTVTSREKIKQLLTLRVTSQPLNKPNAGSVFRNPPGDYAARLIESCGLKGQVIGGAMVSTKHANFIINTGQASAADIEMLIERVQKTVAEKTGIVLVPEVRIIGEAGCSGGWS